MQNPLPVSGRRNRSKKLALGQDFKKYNRKRFFLSENTKGFPSPQETDAVRKEGDISEFNRKSRSSRKSIDSKTSEGVAPIQTEMTESIGRGGRGSVRPMKLFSQDEAKSAQGENVTTTLKSTTQKSGPTNELEYESRTYRPPTKLWESREKAGQNAAHPQSNPSDRRKRTPAGIQQRQKASANHPQVDSPDQKQEVRSSIQQRQRDSTNYPQTGVPDQRQGAPGEIQEIQGISTAFPETNSLDQKQRIPSEIHQRQRISANPSQANLPDQRHRTQADIQQRQRISGTQRETTSPDQRQGTSAGLQRGQKTVSHHQANSPVQGQGVPARIQRGQGVSGAHPRANSPDQRQGVPTGIPTINIGPPDSSGLTDSKRRQEIHSSTLKGRPRARGGAKSPHPHSIPNDHADKEKSTLTSSNSTMKATLFKSLEDMPESLEEPPQGGPTIKPASDPTTSGVSAMKVAEETTLPKADENAPQIGNEAVVQQVTDDARKPNITRAISDRDLVRRGAQGERNIFHLERSNTYTSESTTITGMPRSQNGKIGGHDDNLVNSSEGGVRADSHVVNHDKSTPGEEREDVDNMGKSNSYPPNVVRKALKKKFSGRANKSKEGKGGGVKVLSGKLLIKPQVVLITRKSRHYVKFRATSRPT